MGGVGSMGAWVAWVREFVGDVGQILAWVAWVHNILALVKKTAQVEISLVGVGGVGP